MDTVDRTDLDAAIVFDTDAWLGDHIRHGTSLLTRFPGRESGCATDPLRTAHALVVDELAGSPSIASVPWTRGTNAAWSGATIARHGRLLKREVIVGEAATGPR